MQALNLPSGSSQARDRRRSLAIDILRRIPTTAPERLLLPDAQLANLSGNSDAPRTVPFPTGPIPASRTLADEPQQNAPDTVLYLAYGSNLSAETFLGSRGIRPVSQVNVSAPSLRLVFDLPGIPYNEPCFANTAPRELPKPPVPVPVPVPPVPVPEPPKDVPKIPVKPPTNASTLAYEGNYEDFAYDYNGGGGFTRNAAGDPVWTKGLIGVVYEVTRADYAHIVATEGGGASYKDILVPCFVIPPPRFGVPEKPWPVPPIPKPFLAHTLYAPRLPDLPGDGGDEDEGGKKDGDDDGGDGDKKPKMPDIKWPAWAKKLLLPVRRPDPAYAQPSARYLKLITDGAAEHALPDAYQEYLQALQPYTITTRAQDIGRMLYMGTIAPFFMIIRLIQQRLVDDKGNMPLWVMGLMAVWFNLVWMSYDFIAKKVCRDGERTMEEDEHEGPVLAGRGQRRRRLWAKREKAWDEEKTGLLESDE